MKRDLCETVKTLFSKFLKDVKVFITSLWIMIIFAYIPLFILVVVVLVFEPLFNEKGNIDIGKFVPLIIMSSTMSFLTMEFKKMVKGEFAKEKEEVLRKSAEMFFISTILFVLIYFISLFSIFRNQIPFIGDFVGLAILFLGSLALWIVLLSLFRLIKLAKVKLQEIKEKNLP